MSYTDSLYYAAKDFQDRRKAIVDAFERRMLELEDHKGSKYFFAEKEKAETIRDEALTALRTEYGPRFNSSLKAMQEANSKRGTMPPTEEELRLIQALKMRETVTESELSRIANAVKRNALCLSIIQEVANKNGIVRNYKALCDSPEMPAEFAEEAIRGLASGLRNFMNNDTRNAARLAREYLGRKYGNPEDAPALPKRALFTNKEECFRELAGMDGDKLNAFCAAVD